MSAEIEQGSVTASVTACVTNDWRPCPDLVHLPPPDFTPLLRCPPPSLLDFLPPPSLAICASPHSCIAQHPPHRRRRRRRPTSQDACAPSPLTPTSWPSLTHILSFRRYTREQLLKSLEVCPLHSSRGDILTVVLSRFLARNSRLYHQNSLPRRLLHEAAHQHPGPNADQNRIANMFLIRSLVQAVYQTIIAMRHRRRRRRRPILSLALQITLQKMVNSAKISRVPEVP